MSNYNKRRYILLDLNSQDMKVINHKELRMLIKKHIGVNNHILVDKLAITGTLQISDTDSLYKIQRVPTKFGNLLLDINFNLDYKSSLGILEFMDDYKTNKRVEVVISHVKVYKQVNIRLEKLYNKRIYHCTLYSNGRCTIKSLREYSKISTIPKGKDLRIAAMQIAENNLNEYTKSNNINAYFHINYLLEQ